MNIDVAVEGVKKDVEYIRERMDDFVQSHADMERRIKALEDWRLVFVTKFSVYSAIALAIGSFAAQVLLKYIGQWL